MLSNKELTALPSFHPVTKMGARIFSYLFHPLFIPVYVILFLVYELRLFPDRDDWGKKLVIIQFLVSYTLLPLITIMLMKALGFVQSIQLKTQKDRILPYVVCEIFYFWGWYVSKNLHYPDLVIMFTLAVFLACSVGLIMNSYLKISMHGIAVGTLSAFVIIAGITTGIQLGFFITIAVLIAGITCTSRLIDSNHSTAEIYAGFLMGAFMQFAAYWFV